METSENVLLELRSITKYFPGMCALDDVCIDVKGGEVHALVGENGAGKSTLIKILAGIYTKSEGEIFIHGSRVDITTTKIAEEHGLSFIHQETNLVPYFDTAENVFLGREHHRRFRFLDKNKMYKETKKLQEDLNQNWPINVPVSNLTVVQQKMTTILKALSKNMSVLVFDEPTAALNNAETDELFHLIKILKSKGVGIIYVSHRLEEIFRIADRVTILKDGKHVGCYPIDKLDIETLVEKMIGRRVDERYFKDFSVPVGDVVMEVKNLSGLGVSDVSFSVKAGEILGIGGLTGSGRSTLARLIFGAAKIQSGTISIEGNDLRIQKPKDAINSGIAFVPEDRRGEGIIQQLSVTENIALPILKRFCRRGSLNKKAIKSTVDKYISLLKIMATSPRQRLELLSGGNQQKVVFARWIAANAKVFLFDEPTNGVDVGSKRSIYEMIAELAKRGAAIILISSDTHELLALSDRLLILQNGTIAGQLERHEANEASVMNMSMWRSEDCARKA